MGLVLLKWLKETSFYEKKERNYKNMNFSTKAHIKKKKTVYEFFGLRESWYGFLGVKGYLFQRRKLVEK